MQVPGVDESAGAATNVSMTPDHWQRVAQVCESALEREPSARAAFVAEACGDDETLRREVESLLAHEATPLLLEQGISAVAAVMLGSTPRLQPGATLGPYRVDALLGAGGMGEVYRARKTKVNRDVALKVLPESFTRDPDRLARFTREAHVLASLNHPNIAAIHGVSPLSVEADRMLRPTDAPSRRVPRDTSASRAASQGRNRRRSATESFQTSYRVQPH